MPYLRFIAVFFLVVNNIASAQALVLTSEEKIWLKNHPEIRIAFDNNFPPFEWKNESGQYQGISVDYIHLMEQKLNIKFQITEFSSWSEILQAIDQGKLDVIAALAKNERRQKMMLFTEPHISVPGVIISSRYIPSELNKDLS